MIRIQFCGSSDQLEKLLMAIIQDWDELERWAYRNNMPEATVAIARQEKENTLSAIAALRENKMG